VPLDDLRRENAAHLVHLVERLSAVPVDPFEAECGFTRITGACNFDPTAASAMVAPFYRVRPGVRGAAPELVAIASEELADDVDTLLADYDQQAWNKVFGHPTVVARGEGYIFFRQPGAGVIGAWLPPAVRGAIRQLYVRPEGAERWFLLYGSRERGHERELGRLLRTFAVYRAEEAGGFSVHGSAFTLPDGRAYVLCGGEGAGKTTNLIAALETVPGASLLSNDRVVAIADGDAFAVHGFPHAISVRRGTLLLNQSLLRAVVGHDDGRSPEIAGYDHRIAQTADLSAPAAAGFELSVFFSPAELAAHLGTGVVPRGTLAGVIEIADGEAGIEEAWTRVTDRSAATVLHAHRHPCFDHLAPFWNALLPVPRPRVDVRALDDVPLWRLRSRGHLQLAWERFVTVVAGR
jgi:hypothetical protein